MMSERFPLKEFSLASAKDFEFFPNISQEREIFRSKPPCPSPIFGEFALGKTAVLTGQYETYIDELFPIWIGNVSHNRIIKNSHLVIGFSCQEFFSSPFQVLAEGGSINRRDTPRLGRCRDNSGEFDQFDCFQCVEKGQELIGGEFNHPEDGVKSRYRWRGGK